mgnify:CR=1 FL=1
MTSKVTLYDKQVLTFPSGAKAGKEVIRISNV